MLVLDLVATAQQRTTPTLSLVQQWHREVYRGTSSPPKPSYLGEFRDSQDSDLRDYAVHLVTPAGRIRSSGVAPDQVGSEVADFETSMQTARAHLDAVIPAGASPTDSRQILAVVELAALAHGEWVRIHAFANGNGA